MKDFINDFDCKPNLSKKNCCESSADMVSYIYASECSHVAF